MDSSDMMRFGAPILAAGTVFIAGKALRAGYAAATGTPPPRPDDLDAPVVRVIIVAATAAALTAIINVTIQRGVARAAQRSAAAKAGTI